ncbi:g8174 [Coccomyxa elongata]
MHTVLWERVKGTVSVLPLPFIGRDGPSRESANEEDQVDQALRQVVREEPQDIEEPLIQSTSAVSGDPDLEEANLAPADAAVKDEGSSIPSTVFNLTNTIIGAGIMALPQAVATLGIVLGSLLIFLVYILSHVTIDILARASERTGKWTFSELISSYLGKAGSEILRFFIIINNGGLLITYTIMLGDVLVGKAPEYNGVVTNLTGIHSGDVWYLDRRFVVAMVVVIFLVPLTLQRSLKSLAWAGAVGLFLALGFSSLTVVLVVLAALQGDLTSISWLPNPDLTGPDIKDKILGVFSTLPVIALAYVCHYNVHPLLRELKAYSHRRWAIVLHWSLGLCTIFYLIIGVGLYLVFQDDTQSDVLLNFSVKSLGPLVGDAIAEAITYTVWLGYAFNLVVTYPMIQWGLREVLVELFCGAPTVSAVPWALTTFIILVVTYGIAMVVPNIWPVMTITGATAAVAIGWIYPALILAKTEGPGAWARRGAASIVILLGLVTAVVAVWSTLGPYISKIWGH